MRIHDMYSVVAAMPDGKYFFTNPKFIGWRIVAVKENYNIEKEFYHYGQRIDEFESSDERYRFYCAMSQSDDWSITQQCSIDSN